MFAVNKYFNLNTVNLRIAKRFIKPDLAIIEPSVISAFVTYECHHGVLSNFHKISLKNHKFSLTFDVSSCLKKFSNSYILSHQTFAHTFQKHFTQTSTHIDFSRTNAEP